MTAIPMTRHCLQLPRLTGNFTISVLFALLLLLFPPNSKATTLLEMDIDDIARGAELIFHGTVVGIESIQENGGNLYTYITFEIDDVIKGEFTDLSIELKFLGGEIAGRVVQVSGLRQPKMGETGIYFVESTSRELVNPLLGWSQGHFLIQEGEDGIDRVTTVGNLSVSDVQSVSAIPPLIRRPLAIFEGDNNVAAGIITEDMVQPATRPIDVTEFKSRIRDLIQNQPD